MKLRVCSVFFANVVTSFHSVFSSCLFIVSSHIDVSATRSFFTYSGQEFRGGKGKGKGKANNLEATDIGKHFEVEPVPVLAFFRED